MGLIWELTFDIKEICWYCKDNGNKCSIYNPCFYFEEDNNKNYILSILLKNPFQHSLPHAIPVHFLNGTYQVGTVWYSYFFRNQLCAGKTHSKLLLYIVLKL